MPETIRALLDKEKLHTVAGECPPKLSSLVSHVDPLIDPCGT